MTERAYGLLRLLVLAAIVVTGLASPAAAVQSGDEETRTEDILYMRDGRTLHGQILEETRSEIVFEYVDPHINISTKLRLLRIDIEQIKRDVEVEKAAEPDPSASSSSAPEPATTARTVERRGRVYGARRGSATNEDLTSFYILPMRGHMGLDVNSEVYKDMVDDIRAHNPDYMIVEMDCADIEDVGFYGITTETPGLHGSTALDDYRELVRLLRHELGDIPQVLWIKNSQGISSVVALSWEDLYMAPDAELSGANKAAGNFMPVQADENMFGKFREAYMGWLKGFAENGNYDLKLVDAMVLPEAELSATWKGRDVEWYADQSGQYIVDDNDEATVYFDAKAAEDLRISDGTAETLDDLALLLGIREYRVIDGVAENVFEKHRENWRRMFEAAVAEISEYEKYLSWASGQDAVKYLGRAKTSLEKILAAMNRYKSVEIRLALSGVSKFAVETQIEILKEQIRAARSGGAAGGGGLRGGGGASSR